MVFLELCNRSWPKFSDKVCFLLLCSKFFKDSSLAYSGFAGIGVDIGELVNRNNLLLVFLPIKAFHQPKFVSRVTRVKTIFSHCRKWFSLVVVSRS